MLINKKDKKSANVSNSQELEESGELEESPKSSKSSLLKWFGKKQNKPNKEFQKFSFQPILGISPARYISAIYLVLMLLGLYFLFLDQGLRNPKVQLRFYLLSGPARLYVNGRLHGNLNYSKDWQYSTVTLPAGQVSLRIERSGMQAWEWEQEFTASVWNNYWKPTSYEFELAQTLVSPNSQSSQSTQGSQSPQANFLWQEAWRSYLLRGLEAQRVQSFDASHPYPWVLSEGLRSYMYSALLAGAKTNAKTNASASAEKSTVLPAYWSADIQRGLAATNSVYQWGDLLTAASLSAQLAQPVSKPAVTQSLPAKPEHISLLGPKALAILLRSAVKRLHRLEPYASSLEQGQGLEQGFSENDARAADFAPYFASLKMANATKLEQKKESELGQIGQLAPRIVFEYSGQRFMAIPEQDFVVAQNEVSNQEFGRFWFSRPAQSPIQNEAEAAHESLAKNLLYAEDRSGIPWDWPAGEQLTAGQTQDLLNNSSLLQDLPVRGITWREAQEFCTWFQNQLPKNLQRQWQIQLLSTAQRLEVGQILAQLAQESSSSERQEQQGFPLDFEVAARPPKLSSWQADALGLRGLSGSLWEWLQDDFLPHSYAVSANGYSDLNYKALAGGSWLNVLPVEESFQDLWVDEFLQQNQELPVAADANTIAGALAPLRNPFAGFRMVAVRRDAK